jgi:hypothetical protein
MKRPWLIGQSMLKLTKSIKRRNLTYISKGEKHAVMRVMRRVCRVMAVTRRSSRLSPF